MRGYKMTNIVKSLNLLEEMNDNKNYSIGVKSDIESAREELDFLLDWLESYRLETTNWKTANELDSLLSKYDR